MPRSHDTDPGALPHGLDKIDARILRSLHADGRISNINLAEEVHL